MKNRYVRILNSIPELQKAVGNLPIKNSFDSVAANVISPVLVMYTDWILQQAQELGIQRLYFLARDGYMMYHIAKVICRRKKYPVKCSYFYCSRYALRAAAYRFLDDSAYERLFIHAYWQSPYLLLKRAGFSEEQRKVVYEDISFSHEKGKHNMGRKEFDGFCGKLRKSSVFRNILTDISDTAYAETMAYIRQEEMQQSAKIGIVDLGWTGSLQHTLRRLLDSENISTELYGFYMGILEKPPETKSSRYLTWLFNEKEYYIKSWFAHNLMECLCSAPHGMTMGYRKCGKKIEAVLAEPENYIRHTEHICKQSVGLAKNFSSEFQAYHKKIALKLLHKLMFGPTTTECAELGNYWFCDDIGEQYHRSIIEEGKSSDFRKELLLHKLFFRDSTDGFYWYYGSVQASRLIAKTFYRYDYLLTKYMIARRKGG